MTGKVVSMKLGFDFLNAISDVFVKVKLPWTEVCCPCPRISILPQSVCTSSSKYAQRLICDFQQRRDTSNENLNVVRGHKYVSCENDKMCFSTHNRETISPAHTMRDSSAMMSLPFITPDVNRCSLFSPYPFPPNHFLKLKHTMNIWPI